METHSIHIDINLAGLLGGLQHQLQKTITLVALGLNADSELPEGFIKIPGAHFWTSFAQQIECDKDKFNADFAEWILVNGFRDASELISNFLEKANEVLTILSLANKQDGEIKFTGEDWGKIINRTKQFHRLGLPDKIDHLKSKKNLQLESELTNYILSINTARNCLVHRNGVVGERDANIDSDLEVKWRKLALYLKDDKGEIEITPPHFVEKGSSIAIKNVNHTKIFKFGEKVAFSAQEFSEICWCLFLFGQTVASSVEEIVKNMGFLEENINKEIS